MHHTTATSTIASVRRRAAASVTAVLFAGVAALGAAPLATADPMPEPVAETAPAGPVPVPSAEPVSAISADGWTLAISANSETLTPATPPTPELATNDFIVSGLFNATLRNAHGGTGPTPSGTFEVGYQVQCVPAGMLAAMKPAVTTIEVVKEEFSGANPTASVSDYRIQVDCLGPALIRSYAILTRTTNTTDTVVAYYGVSNPI